MCFCFPRFCFPPRSSPPVCFGSVHFLALGAAKWRFSWFGMPGFWTMCRRALAFGGCPVGFPRKPPNQDGCVFFVGDPPPAHSVWCSFCLPYKTTENGVPAPKRRTTQSGKLSQRTFNSGLFVRFCYEGFPQSSAGECLSSRGHSESG